MNAFDCLCGHPAHKHNVTAWPKVAKLCEACDCTGYAPLYKQQTQRGDH